MVLYVTKYLARFTHFATKFKHNDKGVSALEYAVIAGCMMMIVLVIFNDGSLSKAMESIIEKSLSRILY